MRALRSYTRLLVESEVSYLRCLHGMLEREGVGTRDQFEDMMNAAFGASRLDAKALADDLGYSPSTVYRWIDGRSAPHPSLWPRIVGWVLEGLDRKVAAHAESTELAEFA